jgi:hypothetical protein
VAACSIGFKKKGRKCSYVQYTLLLYQQVRWAELERLQIPDGVGARQPKPYAEAVKGRADFIAQAKAYHEIDARREAAIEAAVQVVREALDQGVDFETETTDPALLFAECEVPTRPRFTFKNGAAAVEASLTQHRDLADGEGDSADEEEEQELTHVWAPDSDEEEPAPKQLAAPAPEPVAGRFRTMGELNGFVRRECWKVFQHTPHLPPHTQTTTSSPCIHLAESGIFVGGRRT